MTNQEQIDILRAKFLIVSRHIYSGLAMKTGGAGAEVEYAVLYDRIAKLGGAQRLRKKYRAP